MSALLKGYIAEILKEMRSNPAVDDELVTPAPKKQNKKTDADKDSEKEMEEMSGVASIAGYTAPLGASSADVGSNPTKPGQKLKKNKKNFSRWK